MKNCLERKESIKEVLILIVSKEFRLYKEPNFY